MTADLARLLAAMQRPGLMSVCHRGEDMAFKTAVVDAREAAAYAARVAAGEADVWISVARVAGPARENQGRGTATDVLGLTALPLDLDIKPGGMPNWDSANAVVADLSSLVGREPAVLVNSGHGLQPWFILDSGDEQWSCDGPDDPRGRAMAALLRRWGRLVTHLAQAHGGAADTAFDVSRLMRCPGTTNLKDREHPVPVTAEKWTAQEPITFAHLDDLLRSAGVDELAGDREVAGDVVLAAGDWAFVGESCIYSLEMTRGWATDAPSMTHGLPGPRHTWLLAQAVRLAAAHRHGCLTESDHVRAAATLHKRFAEVVADPNLGDTRRVAPGEVSDALSWGVHRVEAMSDSGVAAELGAHVHFDGPDRQPTGLDRATGARRLLADLVFDATPELAYLRRLAHATLVSPWTVLAGSIAIVLAEAPPNLKIPPFVGAAASLNSFFAIVGPSGSGKTAGIDVARLALPRTEAAQRNPSSGEGIITLFVSVDRRGQQLQHTTNVLSVVDEVATLGAQISRQGSTLAPILRSAWSGSALSTNGAERARQRNLDANSYRFVMVMGVLPATAGLILDDHGAGTPQRVVWLPAHYSGFPDEDVKPGESPLEGWKMPSAGSTIAFPEHVRALVRSNRLASTRGDVAALDGHALLARLKVAAGLALLHGSASVSDDLWDVSGHIMALSDHTRQGLLRAQGEQNRERQKARGKDEAVREEARDGVALDRAVKILARFVHRHPDGVTRKAAKDACGRYKTMAVEAIQICLERRLILEEVESASNGRPGSRYRPGPVSP
jgi:hypothetical protein